MTELTEGTYYDTVAYGTVEFQKKVKDNTVNDGYCYKFVTTRGRVKYVREYELDSFLRKEQ